MSKNARILIVDDEPAIRNMLSVNLQAAGFATAFAATGEEAAKRALEFHPHLIVLDLGLPDRDGLDVLKSLREWTDIPVLILTVTDDESTKVQVLDAGADDFLTKPFSIPELLARIRVNLRRHHLVEATPLFKSGELAIDLNTQKILVGSTLMKLTLTEFNLLRCLVRFNGRVVSQDQLILEVWGSLGEGKIQYLRIYIGQLRKKLEPDPANPIHILTEPGVGYRIV